MKKLFDNPLGARLRGVLRKVRGIGKRGPLPKKDDPEAVFTEIFERNAWGGVDSVSGPGSDDLQTRVVVGELSAVLRDYGIKRMLDVPCGDFHWMRHVGLEGVDYTGADIVAELVRSNNARFGRAGLQFRKLDLTRDPLPEVDLVFCRDCLVHLSFEDASRALANIRGSRSGYLLSTTFTARTTNEDIKTGGWRPLNLELAPFALPKPLKIITEGCTENDGIYRDKSLGLWRISDLPESFRA